MSLDPAFKGTRALVIDSNKTLLDGTVRQLADLGVAQVLPCRDLARARQMLEKIHFDFVICANEMAGSALTGQALLEALRRDSVLRHTTVFVLLAEQATYLSVMEAAEAALDCLLLRPFRSAELRERLVAARHRRQELSALFEALNCGDVEAAIGEGLRRHQAGAPYGALSGRMAAELLLRKGEVQQALALFREFEAAEPAAWSGLGIARCLMALGDLPGTQREVTALIERHPELPDALDVLGRALVEQGELPAALDAYRRAIEITPNCILRLQHGGTLACYQGEAALALSWLDRARMMDRQSKLFDAMTLMLLALLHSDAGDARALGQLREALKQYQARFPQSRRLQRMGDTTEALVALAQGRTEAAIGVAQALAAEAGDAGFDLEAATILLALWVRLPALQLSAGQQQQLIGQIGRRFCTGRASAAVLLAAARPSEPVSALLREAQATIAQIAEEALQQALQGNPGPAVAALLDQGSASGNARLVALANQLLRRHGQGLDDADALSARAEALARTHCRPVTLIAGMRRTARDAGGLVVRLKTPLTPAPSPAPETSLADLS